MWEHYRKTFRGMQLAMALVAIAVLVVTRRLFVAGAFLAAMQIGAVLGAAWGARLKRMFHGNPGRFPAKRGV